VDSIWKLHQAFLRDLQTAALPDAIINLAPSLTAYNQYVNSYAGAAAILQRLQEKEEFEEWLEEQSSDLGGLNLVSLQIAPIQRIPRYALLLKGSTCAVSLIRPVRH
jgi:hypothetical protein